MQVDKKLAETITRELEVVADAVFEKYGLERKKLSTKYGESYGLSITAEKVAVGDNGVNTASAEARGYELFADQYGLKAGLLGKKFEINGTPYAFAGIATSRPKYPIYAKNLETGGHCFFKESAKRLLNA